MRVTSERQHPRRPDAAHGREAPKRAYAMRMGRSVCTTADDLVRLHQRTRAPQLGQAAADVQGRHDGGVGDVSAMSSAELQKAESRHQGMHRVHARQAAPQRARPSRTGPRYRAGRGAAHGHLPREREGPAHGREAKEYGLLATDGFTGLRWFTPSFRYRDVQDEVLTILRSSRTLTGRYPRLIVSDLGTEFENRTVEQYCRRHGIQHQPTPRGAKELNGIAEKSVGTVKNHTARCCWPQACQTTSAGCELLHTMCTCGTAPT